MVNIPDSLPELTRELIALRKKPGTQERFKSYPAMLQKLNQLLGTCEDAATLKDVLRLDTGYYLPAGYRQRAIEKLLTLRRSPEHLRLYAMQLELFGDVNADGETDLDVDARVDALYAQADNLEQN